MGRPDLQPLFELAKATRLRAYTPYSGHQVGAAILLKNGKLYGGCNVENSSYGGTVCAERVAIQKAVSEEGPIQIAAVLVVTDAKTVWTPCGICRQVIAEFGQGCTVHTRNLQGEGESFKLEELLPHAFTGKDLG